VILLRSLTCYWTPTQRIHQSCIPGTKHTTIAASWRLQHTDTASSAWWNQNVYSLESAPAFSSSSSSSETQICNRREQNLCADPYGNRREPLDFVAHTLSLFLCSWASPCGLDGIDEEDDDDGRATASKKEDDRTDVKALFNPSLTMELDLGMASGISILLFPMCFIKFPRGSQSVPQSSSE